MTSLKPVRCSFCGTPSHAVRDLVASNDLKIGICDDCIKRAVKVIDRERAKNRQATE
jgi:ATP-dependent protease Clp ATPase subunit